MTDRHSRPTVASETYVSDYYLRVEEGHERFASGYDGLSERHVLGIRYADFRPGLRLLDLACARGEVVLNAARLGLFAIGVDYSADAVSIATSVARHDYGSTGHIGRADARELPFRNASFDRITMFDIVEHLYPWELQRCLREVDRLLAPGGRVVIHTMPNLWYYRFGYPLYRLASALGGKRLPPDPRDRWDYTHDVHVNEQTPRSLRRSLDLAGLRGHVFLESWQRYEEDGAIVRSVKSLLTRLPGFRLIFCDDILAIIDKP